MFRIANQLIGCFWLQAENRREFKQSNSAVCDHESIKVEKQITEKHTTLTHISACRKKRYNPRLSLGYIF